MTVRRWSLDIVQRWSSDAVRHGSSAVTKLFEYIPALELGKRSGVGARLQKIPRMQSGVGARTQEEAAAQEQLQTRGVA